MNLLPLSEEIKGRSEYRLRFWTVAGIAMMVLLFSVSIPLVISYFAISYNIDFINNVADSLSKSEGFKKTDAILKIIKDTNRKSSILNDSLGVSARQDILGSFSFIFKTAGDMTKSGKVTIKISQIIYEQAAKKGAASSSSVASTTDSGIVVRESGTHKISIKGFASNRDGFLIFLKGLEANKNFLTIDSPVSNLVNSTDIDFSLALVLKDKAI